MVEQSMKRRSEAGVEAESGGRGGLRMLWKTFLTWDGSGRTVIIVSDFSATFRGELAISMPMRPISLLEFDSSLAMPTSCMKLAVASLLRSCMIKVSLAGIFARRFFAMGYPILPRPMNPHVARFDGVEAKERLVMDGSDDGEELLLSMQRREGEKRIETAALILNYWRVKRVGVNEKKKKKKEKSRGNEKVQKVCCSGRLESWGSFPLAG